MMKPTWPEFQFSVIPESPPAAGQWRHYGESIVNGAGAGFYREAENLESRSKLFAMNFETDGRWM